MPIRHGPEPTWDEELTRLIQHGRDREAAELASDRLAPLTQGAFVDPRTQLDEILPLLNELVAPLDDTQLDAPTPCANFAVRHVLEHMIGGATMFAAAFRGAARPVRPGCDDRPRRSLPGGHGRTPSRGALARRARPHHRRPVR